MADELLINVIPGEIRGAAVHDSHLVELFIERRQRASLVGNVYLGRVQKIIPGMNAAFVEIGLDRAGFLSADAARTEWTDDFRGPSPRIGDMVTEGEAVLVQVVKDAIARKGVQLNRRITLPGRYLVYSPQQPRVTISRMISDEDEQARLTSLMAEIAAPGEGFILRTNAVGATRDDLSADADFLRLVWVDVEAARDQAEAPALLHTDLDPLLRLIRDHVHEDMSRILVDSDGGYAAAREFCARFMPQIEDRLELHKGPEAIFSLYDVEAEIERALSSRIGLPSGGSVVIESTEALTAIDVNSGSFVAGAGPEDTAMRTNLEAAGEIARQLRLRNIAGLIVIDFIHMDEDANWSELLDELEHTLSTDRTLSRVIGLTGAGLVEVTRRRRRESLAQTMTDICYDCGGSGRIASVSSVSLELMRALRREAAVAPPGPLTVCASVEIVDALENGAADDVDELRAVVGRQITFRREPGYGREQFDIMVETSA